VKAEAPALPVLVLSQHDETLYAARALQAGARGYVMKLEATEEVRQAVRAVLNGQLSVSRKVAILARRGLLEKKPGRNGAGLDALTDRELEVFQLIGARRTTRQIASDLRLSVKTIETYREHIKDKLSLCDGTALQDHATQWVEGQPSAGFRVRPFTPGTERSSPRKVRPFS
jgi:DNA-binding NarL/FixJ family response regulator